MSVRLDVAVHLGATWALLMRLSSLFGMMMPPMLDAAHDCLFAALHRDAFDPDGLLGLGSVFLQRFHLREIGAAQPGHGSLQAFLHLVAA